MRMNALVLALGVAVMGCGKAKSEVASFCSELNGSYTLNPVCTDLYVEICLPLQNESSVNVTTAVSKDDLARWREDAVRRGCIGSEK